MDSNPFALLFLTCVDAGFSAWHALSPTPPGQFLPHIPSPTPESPLSSHARLNWAPPPLCHPPKHTHTAMALVTFWCCSLSFSPTKLCAL